MLIFVTIKIHFNVLYHLVSNHDEINIMRQISVTSKIINLITFIYYNKCINIILLARFKYSDVWRLTSYVIPFVWYLTFYLWIIEYLPSWMYSNPFTQSNFIEINLLSISVFICFLNYTFCTFINVFFFLYYKSLLWNNMFLYYIIGLVWSDNAVSAVVLIVIYCHIFNANNYKNMNMN